MDGDMSETLETCLAPLLHAQAEDAIWQPRLFRAADPTDRARLQALMREGEIAFGRDTVRAQLHELLETRHPANELTADDLARLATEHLKGQPIERYGTWVFYPWSKRLVRVLPEHEYRELRTSRNRNKITADEQTQLRSKRIGVVGLSVGQATAITLAMEEVGGELVLADFDCLGLSNLNRLRSGVHNLGINKAVLTAREVYELNPYAHIELFPHGLSEESLDLFLNGNGRLDLLIEECDDFYVKVKVRERARALRIPVLMETSDRGLLDIERFDREPERPLFHGLIEGLDVERFKSMSSLDKIPTALEIIGGAAVSSRMAASLVEVKQTIKTWPQLASAVALGGAVSTDASRRMLLGQLNGSGRFYVDLEKLVVDGAGIEVTPSVVGRAISAEAQADAVVPTVHRSTSAELSADEVRTLVSFGAMAPSGGNSQPWRFEFVRGELRCFHEPERSKAFLDFANLASYVSLGAVVENMHLVAEQQGRSMQVNVFPQANDMTQVCSLRFGPLGRPARDEVLFEHIAKRVTNRKPGVRAPLTTADISALLGAAESRHGRLTLLHDEQQLQKVADLLGPGDRLRFVSKTMHSELVSEIRWTPKEVEQTRDGLDVATLELSPVDLAGLRLASSLGAMELVGKLGGGRALEKPTRKSIAGASAVGLLTIPGGHTPRAMFEGGRALQRVWLTATARGYAFQPMTALVCLFWRLLAGAPELSAPQVRELNELRARYLEVLDVPQAHGEVMLFRLTRADAPTAHSLRRHVDDMLSFGPR